MKQLIVILLIIFVSCGNVRAFDYVMELHGIGQYAKDSWEIFQMNNVRIKPQDKVLQEYLRVEHGV